MLKKMRVQLSCHGHAASNSFNFLCQQWISSTITIVVIAIAMSLPALFWVFTQNLEQVSADWQQGHIALYLKPSLSSQEEARILKQVRDMPGIKSATFKTKEDALMEIKRQEGMQDLIKLLPENPLPAVIELRSSLAKSSAGNLQTLRTELQAINGVEQVKLDIEWIKRLHAVAAFFKKIAHAFMLLLALAVVLVVGNTLRLIIHNKREEIQILKLIGASEAFIQRPFLYSGIWYGIGGAIAAIVFVNIIMLSLSAVVEELAAVYHMHYILLGLSVSQAYTMVVMAIFLGWLGAFLPIKGQLARIEPLH